MGEEAGHADHRQHKEDEKDALYHGDDAEKSLLGAAARYWKQSLEKEMDEYISEHVHKFTDLAEAEANGKEMEHSLEFTSLHKQYLSIFEESLTCKPSFLPSSFIGPPSLSAPIHLSIHARIHA